MAREPMWREAEAPARRVGTPPGWVHVVHASAGAVLNHSSGQIRLDSGRRERFQPLVMRRLPDSLDFRGPHLTSTAPTLVQQPESFGTPPPFEFSLFCRLFRIIKCIRISGLLH